MFRSCVGRQSAADAAGSGAADPTPPVTDDVFTSARHRRTVSTLADDDVEPARVESGVPANVLVRPRPAGRQRQPAERSTRNTRLDVAALLQ